MCVQEIMEIRHGKFQIIEQALYMNTKEVNRSSNKCLSQATMQAVSIYLRILKSCFINSLHHGKSNLVNLIINMTDYFGVLFISRQINMSSKQGIIVCLFEKFCNILPTYKYNLHQPLEMK